VRIGECGGFLNPFPSQKLEFESAVIEQPPEVFSYRQQWGTLQPIIGAPIKFPSDDICPLEGYEFQRSLKGNGRLWRTRITAQKMPLKNREDSFICLRAVRPIVKDERQICIGGVRSCPF
jgi:hypothetical protein